MDIELQLTVENLLARYAHAIDDDQLEAWPDFFIEQAQYRITTAENHERGLPLSLVYADSRAMLRDRVNALRHANVYEAQRYRHLICAVLAQRLDAHTARAVSSFQVARIMHSGETMLFASGRCIDRIRLTGESGRAQFEERIVVLDSRRVDTLMAIPL
jgi:3-phenylpropionate/cinnamic acid dioxygenase small subunit